MHADFSFNNSVHNNKNESDPTVNERPAKKLNPRLKKFKTISSDANTASIASKKVFEDSIKVSRTPIPDEADIKNLYLVSKLKNAIRLEPAAKKTREEIVKNIHQLVQFNKLTGELTASEEGAKDLGEHQWEHMQIAGENGEVQIIDAQGIEIRIRSRAETDALINLLMRHILFKQGDKEEKVQNNFSDKDSLPTTRPRTMEKEKTSSNREIRELTNFQESNNSPSILKQIEKNAVKKRQKVDSENKENGQLLELHNFVIIKFVQKLEEKKEDIKIDTEKHANLVKSIKNITHKVFKLI